MPRAFAGHGATMERVAMAIRLGYNTNGFPFHALDDAVEILAEIGYDGIALTPDVHHLNPFRCSAREIDTFRGSLERHQLSCVVETGSRFLLDARRKHWPTLISRDGAGRRLDLLRRCLRLASDLGAPVVSFWSGASEGDSFAEELDRLAEACRVLLDQADRHGVTLAIEPEPGMLVDGLERFRLIDSRLADPRLALTLDVGHLHLTESGSPADSLRQWSSRLRSVHLDDMKRPVHEHLAFGEGEIDFAPILFALEEVRFAGLASVELSRHGHEAPRTAREAAKFLRGLTGG